jgi:hypothetical protein
MNRPATHILWQSPRPVANQGAVDGGTGGLYAVIALEIPRDPLRPEIVSPSKVEDLLDGLRA